MCLLGILGKGYIAYRSILDHIYSPKSNLQIEIHITLTSLSTQPPLKIIGDWRIRPILQVLYSIFLIKSSLRYVFFYYLDSFLQEFQSKMILDLPPKTIKGFLYTRVFF